MRIDVGCPILAAAIVAADVLSVARHSNTAITFVADSATPFTGERADAASLFWSFSRVIRALERGGHTLVSICVADLVLVDGCILIPKGCKCEPIVDGKVCVFAPPKPGFVSPELAAVKALPAAIDYRSVYYSLAAFLIYTHGPQTGKLGHALARCLDVNPEERSLAVV